MEHMEVLGRPQIHHDRIRSFTSEKANLKIDHKTDQNIRRVLAEGRDAIYERLEELDKEWDIDRVLMLNFSVLVFTQLYLAVKKDRRWVWGPLLQTPFMFMHATMGWCPPSLWFRPMGFRTRHEIQAEREILLSALSQDTSG